MWEKRWKKNGKKGGKMVKEKVEFGKNIEEENMDFGQKKSGKDGI